MRKIDTIIIHCSATKPNQEVNAATIKKWHVEDNGWADIGYHFVINRNGEMEQGRSIEVIGAHCKGHNTESIGICLVGGLDDAGNAQCNYTLSQFEELGRLLRALIEQHRTISSIHGHNEFSNKACPCFDVKTWLKENGFRGY